MTPDFEREIRGVLLISLFIMVVPLIFFPRDFGIRVDVPFSLLSAFELGWYVLIFFILFSKTSAPWVLFFALVTLLYRFFVGIGFGLFLMLMFSVDLSSSLNLGIHQYLPVFLMQAIMSPFILKSSFEIFMKKPERRKEEPESPTEVSQEKSSTSFETSISQSEGNLMRIRSSSDEKDRMISADLVSALNYLREYSGVKGAILVDDEGLVVACDRLSGIDPETFASLGVSLKEANRVLLKKINEKGLERMGIHTPNLWISLNQILSFTLMVVADRDTDELLSVRISQATGMIKRYLEQRYHQKILKGVEE